MKPRHTTRSNFFYIIIFILLIGIAFVPVREFIFLLINVISGTFIFGFANENLMIPYTSISIAMIVGFALFTLFLKRTKGSLRKTKVTLFIISIAVFALSSLFVENMAMKQWDIVLRNTGPTDDIYSYVWHKASDNTVFIFLIDGEYFKAHAASENRAGILFETEDGRRISQRFLREDDNSNDQSTYVVWDDNTPAYLLGDSNKTGTTFNFIQYTILPVVKIHYYVFSIILILIMLNLIYNLTAIFKENRQEISKNSLITQGLAAACYLLAFLFVKVIHYVDFETNYITAESSVSALLCIVLAAVSGGLFVDNLLNKKGKLRLVPSAVSSIIVIILYTAEYFMVGGFYRYGEGFLFESLPLIKISIFNIIIVFLPALIVYFIIKTATIIESKRNVKKQW